MSDLAIGADVGATKIASACITRAGEILATRQTPTRVEQGADAVIGQIAGEINALAARAPGTLCGVGIGVPGLVNPGAGIVINAVNMHWQDIALRDRVRAQLAFDLTVRVENDVRAALRGEALAGAGRGCADFVLLTIGSGLGTAAMVNGHIVHGANYFASEGGHFVIDPQGQPCSCGLRGCAETVLSGAGLLATTRKFLQEGYASFLQAESLTTNTVLEAARANDPAAVAAIGKMGEWLGIIMASASAWLNPARIVIGGGLGNAAFDLLYAPARKTYAQRVLRGSREGVVIVRSQVETSAVGAAALAFDES